jgi:CelD/BcsL family acetyltransferase involved in cellulose biosynthesis
MPRIHVEIGPPDAAIAAQWEALVARAAANVFMNPSALCVVHGAKFAKLHVLSAWDRDANPRRLVGLWALQERKVAPLWPAFLAAPPYDYAFVSNPVVDPAVMDEVVTALLDAIERHPALPNVIKLRYLDGGADTCGALQRALAKRNAQMLTLSERERPFASRDGGVKRSGSTRKKLRQDWNRLSALGTVDIANDPAREAVQAAFETYLAMEADSWKGAQGTALLCDDKDAAFTRRLIGELAAHQCASVALLRVDGRPIAAQVLLYCARTAYTWKTAFDSGYAKYSPGALLVDKIADDMFASGAIDAFESCSPEGGFMNQIWDGRRMTVDLLADVGAKESLNFIMAALGERGYAQLRRLRNRLRAGPWGSHRRRSLAASR